jgi:S-adenosylmethionine:tRNA ribosyltransferase-isomerase
VTAPFTLPPGSEATAPPERRGLARDGVTLLAARPGAVTSHGFRELPDLLAPGDVVVVNTSPTVPARLDAVRGDGTVTPVHVATTLDDGSWVVEVRRPDNTGPDLGVEPGSVLLLPGGVGLRLVEPFPVPGSRLWRAATDPATAAPAHLARYGTPIRYGYLARAVPLAALQNVYAAPVGPGELGSAEMASAGRPFTDRVLVRLVARGIAVLPLVLHTGVSSPELHEPPAPERFAVPAATARIVTGARAAGGRVVAVGTTVTRALESATGEDGVTRPASGWTDLVLSADRPARVVGGLLTGLHAPEASHLQLLAAVAGVDLVDRAYRTAVAAHLLWHEFGDSMLFLP